MQHVTAIRMLLMAKSQEKRVDIIVRGHCFRIDGIEHVVVSSKESRLAAGLEGLETDKSLPESYACGEMSGPVVMIIGNLHNREDTTNEFKTVAGCLLLDTDDISAIAVRDL